MNYLVENYSNEIEKATQMIKIMKKSIFKGKRFEKKTCQDKVGKCYLRHS